MSVMIAMRQPRSLRIEFALYRIAGIADCSSFHHLLQSVQIRMHFLRRKLPNQSQSCAA